MRNLIKNLSPRTKFALLQVAAVGLAFATLMLSRDSKWILETLFSASGVVLGIVGLVRCGRNGQGEWRLLGSGVLVYLASLACWTALALLPDFLDLRHWQSAFYRQAPFFSTGSFVFFGLWPFRSQVSPSQTVRQLIVGKRDLRVGGPAAPDLVTKAERLLGLLLPTCFREFLLDYGEIRGTTVSFLGLGPATDLDRPSKGDFVGATLDVRERMGLPQGYVVCSAGTDGMMACLDTAALQTEIPVVLWNPDTRSVIREAAPSFDQYLIQTLRSKARSR
jgi:hypothetical protein